MTDTTCRAALAELVEAQERFEKHKHQVWPQTTGGSIARTQARLDAAWAAARSALALEADVYCDRDTDGELLIEWSPAKGRSVLLSLRDDGRLSYAFMWDGEKSHGQEQMPPRAPQAQAKPE